MTLISIPEYAKSRGITKVAVYKAIKEGRITTTSGNKVNPDIADKEWSDNSNPDRVAIQGQAYKNLTPSEEARAINRIKYNLLKIQLDEKLGKLIPTDEIEKQAFEAGRLFRDSVMNVPHMICNELAKEANPKKCEDIMKDALAEAIRHARK